MTETRTTSSTGGEKAVKPARFDQLPTLPLTLLAEHYAKGAEKYSAYNWRKGYEWSKAFAALQRHAWAMWGGEDIDPETGTPHMAAVAFHAFSLMQWAVDHPEYDDRYKADDEPAELPDWEKALLAPTEGTSARAPMTFRWDNRDNDYAETARDGLVIGDTFIFADGDQWLYGSDGWLR